MTARAGAVALEWPVVTLYGCDADEAASVDETAGRVGIVPAFVATGPSEANAPVAAGSRCVSVGHRTAVTSSTLQVWAHAGVRYVSTRSIGVDHIDLDAAVRLGITVENVEYSPAGVADFTIMLMLMVVRDAAAILERVADHDYRQPARRGRELPDLTVGVVGIGRIGSAVVERLRGFGCGVLVHDRRPGLAAGNVSLDELLDRCDVVTLHVPLTDDSHHLLDRRRIDGMRPGSIVVNTARGGLVETAALVDALERGHLGGAALDVIEGEDGVFSADRGGRPVDHPLLDRLQRLPNALITPHTAYFTDRSLADAVESSLRNCLRFERSHPR